MIHKISKTRMGAVKQRMFCHRATNTEHDIAHNTKTTDKKILLLPEMRVTKKSSPGRPQKSGHFRNFSTNRKNFLGHENIFQGSEKTLEEEEIFNFVRKDLVN